MPLGPGRATLSARRVPGDLILCPSVVVSIVVLLVNDHVLKDRWPGTFTGKLSDFAGLAFFPVLLVAVVESARWVLGTRTWSTSPAVAVVCSALTAAVFAAVKTWDATADLYRQIISWLQIPLFGSGPFNHIQDPSDLIALPATALVVVLVVKSRSRVSEAA